MSSPRGLEVGGICGIGLIVVTGVGEARVAAEMGEEEERSGLVLAVPGLFMMSLGAIWGGVEGREGAGEAVLTSG
jgi:hypothetical protein